MGDDDTTDPDLEPDQLDDDEDTDLERDPATLRNAKPCLFNLLTKEKWNRNSQPRTHILTGTTPNLRLPSFIAVRPPAGVAFEFSGLDLEDVLLLIDCLPAAVNSLEAGKLYYLTSCEPSPRVMTYIRPGGADGEAVFTDAAGEQVRRRSGAGSWRAMF